MRIKDTVVASPQFKRIPAHVAVIPDGNRRWAVAHDLPKEAGYIHGLEPAIDLYHACIELGIKELTFYGFTHDNTKRPAVQRKAFQAACTQAVRLLEQHNAQLLVIGNHESPLFPEELLPYTTRTTIGEPVIKLNFLVNYDWQWDLFSGNGNQKARSRRKVPKMIQSNEISPIDLLIRWGGRRRLSGMLPVQSVYADFYIIDDYWPDYTREKFYEALHWYENQDVTLGG